MKSLALRLELVAFDLSLVKPLSNHTILQPVEKDIFRILSKKWELVGELVKFESNQNGKVKRVVMGSTPYERVNLYQNIFH